MEMIIRNTRIYNNTMRIVTDTRTAYILYYAILLYIQWIRNL